jgi:hypothetical protein
MYTRTRCSTSSSSTAARAASSCATSSPARSSARGRRGGPRHRRLRQRLLPLHQRHGLQRHRDLARAQAGAYFANPCYTQIHPTCIPVSGDYQSKLTLMSESLRNDGRVWVPKKKPARARPRDPRGRPRLLPRAKYPSFGNLAPRDIASRAAKKRVRRGPRRRRRRDSASTSTSRRHQAPGWAEAIARALRQPLRDVREDHRREPLQDADAHLPRRALHDGRPLGGLQPHEQPSPASSCSARRTSPTTAPTASAPARSCRAWPTATSSSPTPSATTSHGQKPGKVRHDRRTPSSRGPRPRSGATKRSEHQGQAHRRQLPPRARQDHVGQLRHGPHRGGPQEGARADPRVREEFWNNVNVPGSGETSTRASRRPAAWPTSSSSAS